MHYESCNQQCIIFRTINKQSVVLVRHEKLIRMIDNTHNLIFSCNRETRTNNDPHNPIRDGDMCGVSGSAAGLRRGVQLRAPGQVLRRRELRQQGPVPLRRGDHDVSPP